MTAPTWNYKWLSSTGNEPNLDEVNIYALDGWELVSFNGDTPNSGGQRQWVYVIGRKEQLSETSQG